MTTVNVSFHELTLEQAANLFAALKHDYDGPKPLVQAISVQAVDTPPSPEPVVTTTAEPEPAKKPRGRPRKDKVEPTPAADTPPVTPDAEGPTLDQVRTALGTVMTTKGSQDCRDLLARFGVDRISHIKPEQYADFIKACGEVTA